MHVIGASNTRGLSHFLQSGSIDTTVFVNPGCGFNVLKDRTSHMLSEDTDVAVLHLGTNDVLCSTTDGQCMLQCNEALDKIESTHQQHRPNVPLFVCSVPPTRVKRNQWRVDMLNALLWTRCQKSRHLHFLETGVSLQDIGRDGIHLTPEGKAKLATAIVNSVQDFHLPSNKTGK